MSFRVDKELKQQADSLFRELGLNTSVALNMFLTQCVRSQALPFTPTRTQRNSSIQEKTDEKNIKTDEYYDFENIL